MAFGASAVQGRSGHNSYDNVEISDGLQVLPHSDGILSLVRCEMKNMPECVRRKDRLSGSPPSCGKAAHESRNQAGQLYTYLAVDELIALAVMTSSVHIVYLFTMQDAAKRQCNHMTYDSRAYGDTRAVASWSHFVCTVTSNFEASCGIATFSNHSSGRLWQRQSIMAGVLRNLTIQRR